MPARTCTLAAAALALLLAAFPGAAIGEAPPAAAAPVRYTLGLLVRGPGWTAERSAHTDSIQAGHMANIVRMAGLGALVAAGPIVDGGDLRGVFVFAPGAGGFDTLLAGDPAIASGRLECRLSTWVAPPGIGDEYRRRHAEGAPDSMVTFGWVILHRGPRYDSRPTPAVEKLIARHLAHTERLRADGMLVFAGAVEGTGDLRGVLVMRGDSGAVARAVRADPAVRAGRFTPQVLHWWTARGTIPGH